MIGTSLGAVLEGISGHLVRVEADVVPGFPQFSIVGLPDSAVTESKLRIRSAIRNTGIGFPSGRITVNLSPASLRKHGAGLDLAIAVSILRAVGIIPTNDEQTIAFCAELSLSGTLMPVREAFNLTVACLHQGVHHVVVATTQQGRQMLQEDSIWFAGDNLLQVCESLNNMREFGKPILGSFHMVENQPVLDIAEVDGLDAAKRALVIAASGRHHILLIGPPGSGKTMLAERFGTILPNLTTKEAAEVYAIQQAYHSVNQSYTRPPLRSPHHSLTPAGLIGGGNPPHPGEVSFAHQGVLLLDEMLEFARPTLESLREPLTERAVHISRAGKAIRFPSDFILIATTNPCPCGKRGFGECVCSQATMTQYFKKLSGPLLDRIEIVIKVEPHLPKSIQSSIENSMTIRDIVQTTRQRLTPLCGAPNTPRRSQDVLSRDARLLVERVSNHLKLSRRGLDGILRVARTISALTGTTTISSVHIEEALFLRNPFTSQ